MRIDPPRLGRLHRTLASALASILLSACAATGAAAACGSPKALLERLHEASKSGHPEQFEDLVYGYFPYSGIDDMSSVMLAWQIVAWNNAHCPEKYTGDFSYSERAMDILLSRHADQFGPVPDEWQRQVDELPRMRARGESTPEAFCFFEKDGCHILLAKCRGSWKLCFWEGLNHLLPPTVQKSAGEGSGSR